MKILVTGAKGFVGRNLCENLKAVRDGKNRTRPALQIEDVFEYDLDTPPAELDHFCVEADFVFNLAGVNRPKNNDEFMQGNFGFASTLLDIGLDKRPVSDIPAIFDPKAPAEASVPADPQGLFLERVDY